MISCSIYLENNKHICNLCFIETPKRGEYIRLEGINVLYLVKDIHHVFGYKMINPTTIETEQNENEIQIFVEKI